MTSVTGIDVNNQNYQMTFKAKGSKATYKVVDQMHDMAKEFTSKKSDIKKTTKKDDSKLDDIIDLAKEFIGKDK